MKFLPLTRALLAGTALILVTTTSHAALITGGTETATGTSYSANFMQGYDFVAVNNVSLSALGWWDQAANGLPGSYQLGLWNTSTQTLLASATLDSSDPLDLSLTVNGGNWRYETLGSPVALAAGTTYTLAWQSTSSPPGTADSLYIDYPTLTTDPNVTVANSARFLSTAAFTFPTNSGPANNLFKAQANALFAPIPEPGTALFGLALVGACGLSRRRRRVLAR